MNGKLVVPEDRLKLIRQLEKEMVEERIRRRKEKRRIANRAAKVSP